VRILVTGAAGSIGSVVCDGLVERGHTVAGLDLVAEPEGFPGPWVTADCADPDAVDAAFAQLAHDGAIDAVVHLAGIPDEASLPEILTSHVVTTAALLDAMVGHGVTRIVYASSNHAVGRTPRTDLLDTGTPGRPDTFYGVGKVAAEACSASTATATASRRSRPASAASCRVRRPGDTWPRGSPTTTRSGWSRPG
jgi:uronate dehydrogenase